MEKKLTRRRPSLADDILESLLEALEEAKGRHTVATTRIVHVTDSDARAARMVLGLSQNEFASLIGTGVGTVRKWELGTRNPSGAARTLIEVIKAEPKALKRALGKLQRSI